MGNTIALPCTDQSALAVIRAAFPGATTRRDIKLESRESYQVSDYWSGGSREECAFVDLASGRVLPSSALPEGARQTANNPFNLAIGVVKLSPGFCVVEHVYFRGKDLGYRIYVHPSDTPRLLPSKVQVDLSERDRRILASIRSLKSGNYRREALAALSCTDSDLDRLAGLGLLKRTKSGATSITTEGRNASSGFNV